MRPQDGNVKANCREHTPFEINSRGEKQACTRKKTSNGLRRKTEEFRVFFNSSPLTELKNNQKICRLELWWSLFFWGASWGERSPSKQVTWIYLKQGNVFFSRRVMFVVKMLNQRVITHLLLTHPRVNIPSQLRIIIPFDSSFREKPAVEIHAEGKFKIPAKNWQASWRKILLAIIYYAEFDMCLSWSFITNGLFSWLFYSFDLKTKMIVCQSLSWNLSTQKSVVEARFSRKWNENITAIFEWKQNNINKFCDNCQLCDCFNSSKRANTPPKNFWICAGGDSIDVL